MSERLQILLRQQTLLKEHLAWLENEIAQASPASPHTVPPPATSLEAFAPPVRPTPAQAPEPVSVITQPHDNLFDQYASQERQDPQSLRKGCLSAFIALLGFMILVVAAIWWWGYRT